jgi:cytosine/adenosine deaminase-related metal-dependent hydrolase
MKTQISHYRARWIYPVDSPPIENGVVSISQGKIASLGKGRSTQTKPDGKLIDLGEGVILPALINAHTHLDLSALKGHLDPGTGFLPWVKQLLAARDSLSSDDRLTGLKKALEACYRYGTIAAGDWTGSLELESHNHLGGLIRCAFFEVIGFSDQMLNLPASLAHRYELRIPNSELSQSRLNWISLGAHAPHSTSAALIKAAKTWTAAHHRLLSIHVAESQEEEEFLFTGQGPWREFLVERGKWPGKWKAPGLTSVGYLNNLGVLDDKTVCVHLTRASSEDLQLLLEHQTSIVLCPRSNYFISRSLPPLSVMLRLGLNPAMGTDSLASNQDLNLWEEMVLVHRAFPEIAPEIIIRMATLNGAKALALDNELGSISQGKNARLLFLPLGKCSAKELPEAMIDSRGSGLMWIDGEKE